MSEAEFKRDLLAYIRATRDNLVTEVLSWDEFETMGWNDSCPPNCVDPNHIVETVAVVIEYSRVPSSKATRAFIYEGDLIDLSEDMDRVLNPHSFRS